MNILKESPLYQELTALAREEGYEEGREEGREEAVEVERLAHLQTLQRLLSYRYQTQPDYLADQLQSLDIDTIKQVTNAAFDMETLAEFETFINHQMLIGKITTENAHPAVETGSPLGNEA